MKPSWAKFRQRLAAAQPATMPTSQETADQQAALARGELIRQKLHADEVANWALMNANLQHHMLTAQAQGLDPYKSVIPWGSSTSTVNNVQQRSCDWVGRLAVAAIAALGLGAGGLGIAALAGMIGNKTPAMTPAVCPSPTEQPGQYEWVLDVERHYEHGIDIGRTDSGSDSGGGTGTAAGRSDDGAGAPANP